MSNECDSLKAAAFTTYMQNWGNTKYRESARVNEHSILEFLSEFSLMNTTFEYFTIFVGENRRRVSLETNKRRVNSYMTDEIIRIYLMKIIVKKKRWILLLSEVDALSDNRILH